MFISDKIDAFRRGALDIDCKKMILTQRQENGERYEGQGYIRQDEDGDLVFKLYVAKYENTEPLKTLLRPFSPGKLRPEDTYYNLAATDRNGTTWTASHIMAAIDWDASDRSALARGTLLSIVAHSDRHGIPNYLRLHFFEEYRIPIHLMTKSEDGDKVSHVMDRAEFEACGCKFEVRVREGSGDTIIDARSEAPLPTGFHLRVQEALQFISGKPAMWRARTETKGDEHILELGSPTKQSPGTQFLPPISPVSYTHSQRDWDLFSHYLAYVVANTDETHWNPVAYHLYNACVSTANSIDAWAIGVSIAVEAVSDFIHLPSDSERQKRVALFQDRMRRCLASHNDFADLAPRMEGFINAMSNRNVKDTLYALTENSYVEKSYVKSWEYLRNRHVHPKPSDLKKPDLADIQTLLNRIHQVEVLLRQVVFYLIGYRGPFTDYGAENFPLKQYPLVAATPD